MPDAVAATADRSTVAIHRFGSVASSAGVTTAITATKASAGADAYMLRRKPFRYGEAAVIGFLVGAVLFLLHGLAFRADSTDQLYALLFAVAGGALTACGLAFLWNWAWRRAHRRHDERRGIYLTGQERRD